MPEENYAKESQDVQPLVLSIQDKCKNQKLLTYFEYPRMAYFTEKCLESKLTQFSLEISTISDQKVSTNLID